MKAPPAAPRPRVFADLAAVAEAAARHVVNTANACLEERGEFRLAVSGGPELSALFDRLAREPERALVDWTRVTLLFTDERAAPPGDPGSNHARARVALLDPLGDPLPRVRRMRGESAGLEAAAREYDAELAVAADLVVLSPGEAGELAGLFPHSPLLAEERLRAASVPASGARPPGLTLTPRALREAREGLLVLAAGAAKAAAARAALAAEGEARECPARLARGGVWMLDAAAAGRR